jgi:type III restriction enzyme
VLWVVPSDAIYRQTWKHLANREHPYRQMLERASGGRVKMLEKMDAFTLADTQNFLCIMVLMLPSAARKSKETLRMFRDSGKFPSFYPAEDDSNANRELLEKVPNLALNDLADLGWQDGVAPGSLSIKQSLGNTLRLLRPVVIIDEGHKAYSDTARSTVSEFNPRFILELSATPNPNGKHQSNVLVNVSGTALKDEQMIKLPINLINVEAAGWKHTLAESYAKLGELARDAEKVQSEENRYIRPILLVRVERTGKEQRDGRFIHAEDAKEYLLAHCGAQEEEIRLKTSEKDEIRDEDLLHESSPVRVIITKDALREGWDCPFAYVLAVLSKTTANTALTQMIGRVLRQPHARITVRPALNESYVYTFDQEVSKAVECVRKGLEEEGMGDLAANNVRISGADAVTLPKRRETIERRDAFKNLPPIFLPRILCRSKKTKDGFRPLDYDRDILGELDWESLHFLRADEFQAQDQDKLKRTVARVNIEKKEDGQFEFTDALLQSEEEVPDDGLDFPFLVRQLMEVIPNPWQAARILEETLSVLRESLDEKKLYANRLILLSEMKKDLKLQVYGGSRDKQRLEGVAEKLFRGKLQAGDIQFKLVTSNNPALSWQIKDTLEVELTGTEFPLLRKDGCPVQKALFEKVFEKDFNHLEKNAALHLDGKDAVFWWHRIAVRQGYSLQGWQRNKIYPDFLACIHSPEKGKYRFVVLETKGEHLKGNDDTEYKQQLFDLLAEHFSKSIDAGELLLDEKTDQMSFKMLLEDNWQQELEQLVD